MVIRFVIWLLRLVFLSGVRRSNRHAPRDVNSRKPTDKLSALDLVDCALKVFPRKKKRRNALQRGLQPIKKSIVTLNVRETSLSLFRLRGFDGFNGFLRCLAVHGHIILSRVYAFWLCFQIQ